MGDKSTAHSRLQHRTATATRPRIYSRNTPTSLLIFSLIRRIYKRANAMDSSAPKTVWANRGLHPVGSGGPRGWTPNLSPTCKSVEPFSRSPPHPPLMKWSDPHRASHHVNDPYAFWVGCHVIFWTTSTPRPYPPHAPHNMSSCDGHGRGRFLDERVQYVPLDFSDQPISFFLERPQTLELHAR